MPLTTQPFAHLKELDEIAAQNSYTNVGQNERIGSVVAGGALVLLGLARPTVSNILLSVVGSLLVYRGVTGHCQAYSTLDINTADGNHRGVKGNHGFKVEKSIRIKRPAADLFSFWRNLENLPRIMPNLESVTVTGERLSHWVAKGPAGVAVEWDAEIINEHPNKMIAWQSLPGAKVENAGSIWFTPHGNVTDVKVSLQYQPPAGVVGVTVAKLSGVSPDKQLQEDLERFQELMEKA